MRRSECSVAIYLYGDEISLDIASELMALNPTSARVRGETRTTSSGKNVVQKIGYWEYRIKTDEKGIASALKSIFAEVATEDVLVGKAGITKAELDIYFPLGDRENDQLGFSFELPSDVLIKISKLGLDLVVSTS